MNFICSFIHESKVVIVMVLTQALSAGINVFYKLAVADGMSPRILVAYRFAFATAFVVPFALVLERNCRMKLTWTVLFQGFLSGLCGGMLNQNLFIEGLALSSATLATAMSNLIPAATFVFAVIFRYEKLQLTKLAGIAKFIGTVISVGGAMVLSFYNGKEIKLWSTNINLAEHFNSGNTTHKKIHSNQLLGSLLVTGGCLVYALWYIIQAKLNISYPQRYSSTALFCGNAAVQAAIYAFIMERDWSAWKLGLDIRLLTCFYAGITSTIIIAITNWCIRERGPLFSSAFLPLMLIYVAIVSSLFLGEKLYLGSVLGSALLIFGLYGVLWGKGKDFKENSSQEISEEDLRNERSLEGVAISPSATAHDISCRNTSSNKT